MMGYMRVGAELVGEVHFVDELGKFIYLFFFDREGKMDGFRHPALAKLPYPESTN